MKIMSLRRNSGIASIPTVNDYLLTEMIGKGTFGTVYKAFKKDKNRELVAIKCIAKNSLSKPSIDNLITEISINKKVKNRFIVEFKDFQWNQTYIFMIFEYCSGGELAQLLKRNKRFTEPIVRHFLQQIATALKALRAHDIAHMDLKPQNILIANQLSANCCQNVVLKIADFGFAQYLRNEDQASDLRGSPLYMAPEILLSNQYDASVDLWSVGIILYECLFGSAPYSSSSFAELAQKIKNPGTIQIPETIKLSNSCRDLLKKLLERDPSQRISFENFFDHSFIDLEYMPTEESYKKAIDLIQEAVKCDLNCDHNQSFKLYTKALQYLVPIYNWGDGSDHWDQNRKEILKNKICQYMDRAEYIKKKCNLIVVDKQDFSCAQKAYQCIEEAISLAENKKLKKAFDKYNEGIEIGLDLMSKLYDTDKANLYAQIDKWITEAEDIKIKLKNCDKLRPNKINKINNNNINMDNKSGVKSISFDNFISTSINSRDLRHSPTCYVQ